MNHWPAALGNRLWQLVSWPEYRRFRGNLNRLKTNQLNCLSRALSAVEGTHFASRYELASDWEYSRFRDEIPLHDYEDLKPYYSAKGGILGESVKVWEPTGGSTGGCKWIPWTGSLQAEFSRAVSAWVFDLYSLFPSLRNGRSYWQLTPTAESTTPDWLKNSRTGFESDGEYLGSLGRMLERAVLLQVQKDAHRFWERTIETLVGAPDLRFLSCWSPTFLLLLKDWGRQILGCWTPEQWWPELRVISCWTHGPSKSHHRLVQDAFPSVSLQGKGLLSTEAVTTIPFLGTYPLAFRSHFFEFEDEDGVVWPSWSLTKDSEYHVLQTTSGGLIRYRSGDLVRVTGYLGEVPCLEFLCRSGVLDRCGEKLSCQFLEKLLNSFEVETALGFWGSSYVLFLADRERAAEIRLKVESELQTVFTYRDCQVLGQLGPLRCYVLESTAEWSKLRGHYGKQKLSRLLPDGCWTERMKGKMLDFVGRSDG